MPSTPERSDALIFASRPVDRDRVREIEQFHAEHRANQIAMLPKCELCEILEIWARCQK